MSVLVSNHFVYAGRVGGAEHMSYNLVRGLNQAEAQPVVLCTKQSNLSNRFVQQCETDQVPIIECGGTRGPRFFVEQLACLNPSLRGDAILFPNYFLPPLVPSRLGPPTVVIHDFQYLHYPQYFSAKKRAWLRFSHARALRHADNVIFISEFVRQDATRWFGSIAQRGKVIPNPISWDRFSTGIECLHPVGGRPYILSVAAHYPHKQLDILLKAFADFSCKRPDFCLVLVGQLARNLVSTSDGGTIDGLIGELNLANRVRVTGYLTEAELGTYYRHATAFAFPSVFEGFGMPVVEALGFGLPCLTTNRTAIPEATMGLATYVENAADVGEWSSGLLQLVDAPPLGSSQIRQIKDRYHPGCIGQLYKSAMIGNRSAHKDITLTPTAQAHLS